MMNLFENLQTLQENNCTYYKIIGDNVSYAKVSYDFISTYSLNDLNEFVYNIYHNGDDECAISSYENLGDVTSIKEITELEYYEYFETQSEIEFNKYHNKKDSNIDTEENDNNYKASVINEFKAKFKSYYKYSINLIPKSNSFNNQYIVTGVKSLKHLQQAINRFNNETNHKIYIINDDDSYVISISK